eukprot:g61428.t1
MPAALACNCKQRFHPVFKLSIASVSRTFFTSTEDKGKKKRCDVETPLETPADSEMSEDSGAVSELAREVVEICSEEDT